MLTAVEAIERLKEGNRRFASGCGSISLEEQHKRCEPLLARQEPIAVILGCSDSRVPVEIIFDQGLGDLFVIRVIGGIVMPSQAGSIEYAATELGTRLIVVLGHTNCGAVQAAVDSRDEPSAIASPNLEAIIERIRPAVRSALEAEPESDRAALVRRAVRANVRGSAAQLHQDSAILRQLIEAREVLVVGAEYSLESGQVDFFASDCA